VSVSAALAAPEPPEPPSRDAILGGLVIAIIENGLGLLGTKAYLSFLITGVVLLLAATMDALARRRRSSTGR
jgi:D-xylose transport system permease protein